MQDGHLVGERRRQRRGRHRQAVVAIPPDRVELELRVEHGIEAGVEADLPEPPPGRRRLDAQHADVPPAGQERPRRARLRHARTGVEALHERHSSVDADRPRRPDRHRSPETAAPCASRRPGTSAVSARQPAVRARRSGRWPSPTTRRGRGLPTRRGGRHARAHGGTVPREPVGHERGPRSVTAPHGSRVARPNACPTLSRPPSTDPHAVNARDRDLQPAMKANPSSSGTADSALLSGVKARRATCDRRR